MLTPTIKHDLKGGVFNTRTRKQSWANLTKNNNNNNIYKNKNEKKKLLNFKIELKFTKDQKNYSFMDLSSV